MFRTILATLFLSTLGFVASGAAQAQQLPQNAAYSLCQLDPAHPTGIRCVAFGGGSCVASPAGFPDDWRCSPPGHPGFAECRVGPFFSVRTQSAELSCDFFDGPGFCFEPRSELPGTLVCHAVVVTSAIGVSPSSIAFPDQEIGTASALQTVTITSVGNGPLAIFSLTASGDFQVASSDCPGSLSVGSFCQVGLRFVPTEAGARPGQLAIHHNAPGGVAAVALSGIGLPGSPALVISPSTLNFGSRYYGTLSGPSVVTLTNSGSAPLVIAAIELNSLDYSLVSNTCPSTLSAGASCELQVTFRPYAVGARVGEIRLVTDAAGSPHFVGLSGTGGGATFSSMNAGFLTSLDLVAITIRANYFLDLAEKSGNDDIRRPCNRDLGPCPPDVVVEAERPRCGIQFPELCFNSSPRVCFGNCTPDPHQTLANWISWTSRLNERIAPDEPEECEAEPGGEVPSFAPPHDIGKNASVDSPNEAGDPINLGAANKFHEQIDYAGSDSSPLVFVRTYNSQPFESTAFVRQSFGPAWTSNLDRSITVLPDGTSAIVTRGDGKSFRYARQPGAWTADPGVVATLQMLTDAAGAPAGWKYTGGSGDVETFDALGRWTTFTLRDGKAFALSYDSSGRLQQVASPSGRRLAFEYDTRGRVARMVDPAGAGTSYTYDSLDRLTGVTYADGRSRGYRYDHPTFAFSLTGIVDAMGRLYASFAYDEANRPVSSQFAGGVGATTIAYNADGTVSVTDPDGTVWTRTFVMNQGIAQATSIRADCADCAGQTRTFRYDELGRLVSMRDARLIERNYRYDSRGLLASVVEASGTPEQRETTFTWDVARKLMTGSSKLERSTRSTLDALGRPTNETSRGSGLSRTTTYSYDSRGLLESIDGPRTDVSDITRFVFNADGTIASVTNPAGQRIAITSYDPHGRPLSISHPNGRTTSFTYDPVGRLLSETSSARTTSYRYDANGLLESRTTDGITTTYRYDAAQRFIGSDNSRGEKIRYTLDNAGRRTRTESFDSTNFLTTQSSVVYDGLGRVKQTIGANCQVTTYRYDAEGNVTRVEDPLGKVTEAAYDSLNRPFLVTDPLNGRIGTKYNGHGEVTEIADANGNATRYSYSGLGDRASTQSPDAGSTSATFDSAGNTVRSLDARGKAGTYTYDALGRLVRASFAEGQDIVMTYDVATNGVGRLASVTDPSGTTIYTYDGAGRTASRTTVIGGISKTITYARDSVGRVTGMTYPSGRTLTIAYGAGRITSLALDGRPIASEIQYFPFGGPESWLFGNGKEYTRYVDRDGRIARYLTVGGERRLSFDAASRITRIEDVSAGVAKGQQFDYDALGRLTDFSGFTSASSSEVQKFSYDANGNRLSAALNGSAQSYSYFPGTNRLASITQGALSVASNTFDASGNLLSDGARSFKYDARGRMVQAVASGLTTSYVYNALGQRVKKSNASQTRLFVYDDAGHMLGEYDETGAAVQELVWLGDTPIAVVGKLPTACTPGAYAATEFSTLGSDTNLEVRGGGRGNQDWETRLAGTLTNENGGQARGNQNWGSGKRYRWTLTYDGRGGGSIQIADENGNDVGNVYMGTVASGLRTGNAIRFRVRAQAGLGEAAISATISQIGAEVIGRTLTTAGNNQVSEQSFAFTSPVLEAGFTASGTFTISFKGQIPGGGGLQFLVDAGNATCRHEETAFIWTDHLNTPRQVTDPANRSLWAWDSTPFGETPPAGNPSKLGTLTFNQRFAGQYFDEETGLHQNWHRDYAATIGRYIQSDPIGLAGGFNHFAYAGADPIGRTDKKGLSDDSCYSNQFWDTFFNQFLFANETLADNALKIALGMLASQGVLIDVGGMSAMQGLRYVLEEYIFSPRQFRNLAAYEAFRHSFGQFLIRSATVAAIAESGLALGAAINGVRECMRACYGR